MPRLKLEQVDLDKAIRINGNTTTQVRDDVGARNPASIEYEPETGLLWLTPKRGDGRTFCVRAEQFQAYPFVEKKVEPVPLLSDRAQQAVKK